MALMDDITLLKDRIDKVGNTHGRLIHDIQNQISWSRIWGFTQNKLIAEAGKTTTT
jgi:hypothetical protein